MTVGLVLGKFAPLHLGHQLVMDTATAQTENQVFVIYDSPSVTDIPLPVRANWIRTLYPEAEVIEAWGGPEEVGLSLSLRQAHEQFLARILDGRKVTHFFNSEEYGDHVARSLGAVNVQVDPNRNLVPISASVLRSNPGLQPSFLSQVVLQDLIRKVVFLGAPSTGKSTIAAAAALKFETAYMPEYGREYWERHAVERRLKMCQLEEIAHGHLERENALISRANQTLFVDTDASTTAVFADYYHGRRSSKLDELALQAARRYDLTFLCLNDFEYADTEDRSGEGNQVEFQRRIVENLRAQGRPYIDLGGKVEERLKTIEVALAKHRLFSNPADWSKNA